MVIELIDTDEKISAFIPAIERLRAGGNPTAGSNP
jgi:PII-like signaling protein